MKRLQSGLSVLLALLIALPFFPGTTAAAQDTDQNVPDYSGRSDSFARYAAAIADRPAADTTISLNAADAVLSPTLSEKLEGDSAVRVETGGYVEWTFSADKSGVYEIGLSYLASAGKGQKPQITLTFDGSVPYTEASHYELSRVYRDAGPIEKNAKGDDLIPEQVEVERWQDRPLLDTAGLSGRNLCLYLEEGAHTLRLACESESLYVRSLSLSPGTTVSSDAEKAASYQQNGYQSVEGFLKIYQAEKTLEKSDVVLYPTYDRTSPATIPYDPVRIRRNTIGKGNWSEPGMWISYLIDDIPSDGLYYITSKFRQADAIGVTTFRNVYVNGSIPSKAYENVSFPYGVDWNQKTVVDENGEPCPVYLTAGENELLMEVSLGPYVEAMRMVDDSIYELNRLYTQMVMITGTTPDSYRDYELDKEIPGLLDAFHEQADALYAAAALFESLGGEEKSQSEDILGMARRLESLIRDPRSIQKRLSSYREGISALSSWLYDRTSQPLEMDYLIVHSAGQELPSPRASFWQQVSHFFKTFFASFLEDYNTVGGSGSEEGITVWANIGRDQIQVIKNLVVDQFTPQTGIDVTLSVVQTGFIEATLAGRGPDVAIGMARGQPVNLACRNALLPFDSYGGFEDMKKRFSDTALVPYQYNGKTYGIPCTQTFFMLFYRKDILSEMGIAIPQTWTDIMETVPKLQRSHMTIGLPYAVISAATAVDNGLGAKDLFATLLLQNGGTFYNEDHSATALDSEASMSAFKTWSDFYTKYGFDLVYDFYTRFSTGEMPIGIASYEMFNTLSVAAQEIRGLWGMAPVPGTIREDGTVDTSEAGAGSAAVIFKKAASPDNCYRFVDWWTSDKTQTDFCTAVENQLGPGGRYATANLAAFSSQPWSPEELEMLTTQRENVIELPEIPGSYYVSRSIDNAFRAVLYDKKNPRETFEKENRNINEEIARKRRELGLDNEGKGR